MNPEVESRLRSHIKKARDAGYQIVPNIMRGMIGGKPCCCALGAVVLDVPAGEHTWIPACERLGITMLQATSFAIGFDMRRFTTDNLPDMYDLAAFSLGRKLRAEVSQGLL